MRFLHLITNFYNFALKIEISSAKSLVKSISETRNTNAIAYVWFIHSYIKSFLETCSLTKNNS